MNCGVCATPAEQYRVTLDQGAVTSHECRQCQRQAVYQCGTCSRHYLEPGTPNHDCPAGGIWKWLPLGGYCSDPECRDPIWRFAAHPVTGQPMLLWPKPDTITAVYFARPLLGEMMDDCPVTEEDLKDPHIVNDLRHSRGAQVVHVDYCPECAPVIGAQPSHLVTAGGDPMVIGSCAQRVPTKERHPHTFTDAFGEHLRAWTQDFLHLDEPAALALVAQWESDRAA